MEGAAADYREAMIILRQQEEYTEDDLEMFQMKIDNFCLLDISPGCTESSNVHVEC